VALLEARTKIPATFLPTGVWLAALCLLLPSQILAQGGRLNPPTKTTDLTRTIEREQGVTVHVTVLKADGQRLDQQSVVKLYSKTRDTTNWQTTTQRSVTDFGGLSFGTYDLEVSAVGFLTAHKQVEVANLVDTVEIEVVLERDPSAIDLDSADASTLPKASIEMKRAVKALKSGNLAEARKRLESTEKFAPASAQLKFLFGYLYFQKDDLALAQTYLTQATTLNPHYAQALTLLGRVQLRRGQTGQASTTLEQAVAADPDSWASHNLLADAYLEQHEYEKARLQAQLAIDKGGKDGAAAQLVLAEALANLGKLPEGIEALKTFLQSQPRSPAVPRAQDLLRELDQRQSSAIASGPLPAQAPPNKAASDVLLSATSSKLPDTNWQPPSIDRGTPPVAAGVACPFEKVLTGAGERVQQFVDDIAKFAAIEDLLHERLDEVGNPTTRETRKFEYAAAITQTRPGIVLVDEYRTERYGLDSLPDEFADNGFAALALVFHPAIRDDFHMTCEGLGEWRGQATWLVQFRQREDRDNHIQAYVAGNVSYPVNLKGRAWITADKFQIVRIESEMMSPLPQMQLLAEHQITEYAPVPFPKKHTELWLPKSAEVYMFFRGRRYYRKHSFEKYMLFSVDEEQKDREAKHDPAGPGSTSPRKRKHWQS
jgi:tetratricopeptide (TPR) repeat protein